MSKPLSPERRKIVMLGGGIAAGSAATAMVANDHPMAGWIWLGLLLIALVYVATQLLKLKRRTR